VFRVKIIAKPLKSVLVLWIVRIPQYQYVEKLSEALGTSTVFRRPCPFSCNTDQLEGILMQKNLFQSNIMLPTVPKVVFI
jgi:hypothetical protein